ncbi:MAG TPA: AIR synthase related protein [Candidatus Lokiarchaeia archaeon]|nr:AIR synthase related protein [Candidatus Lokiarchaeia archaeon]
MDFEEFTNTLINHVGIQKKFIIHDVLKILEDNNNFDKTNVYKDIGEDAAALHFPGESKLVLIATDMISADFVAKAPFSAGYSAIVVCIDDIFACGGMPLTTAIDMQASTTERLQDVIKGAKRAAEQFGISITRGHTALKPGCDAVASTAIGWIDQEQYISAGGALPGDALVIIWDADGKRSRNGPYWDTITFKDSAEVLQRRAVMNELARDNLLHASKDISDAGIIGTALMMLNYSRAGCEIDADKLKIAFNVQDFDELAWFSTAYLTTGFLVAIPEINLDRAKNIALNAGLEMKMIGSIVPGSEILIVYENGSQILFDWQKTPVFPALD